MAFLAEPLVLPTLASSSLKLSSSLTAAVQPRSKQGCKKAGKEINLISCFLLLIFEGKNYSLLSSRILVISLSKKS